MAKLYVVYNYAGAAVTKPGGGTNPGQVTSGSLYTQLQIVPDTNSPLKIVEWNVSFDGSVMGTPFACDLVETGTVVATVTSYAVGDVMPYDDPNAPANTAGSAGGTTGIPLRLSTSGASTSGFLSSSEGSITATRVFDNPLVDPVAGYCKQFPLGREPAIKPGNVLRVRVVGDGTRRCTCSVVFEV